jgi:hypothetical protein
LIHELRVDSMAKLTDLGFSKGAIVETIVSTYNMDGQPNAAPMGAIMENEQRIVIKLYNSSLTYKNLQTKKCAVINVTSDVEVFYRTAFKETNPDGTLPQEWFEKAETVNAPQLRMADATIEISATDMTPIGAEKTEAQCDVKLVKAAKTLPKAYNRALPATVEAIIHATRVKVLISDEQEQKHVSKLLEMIEDCNDVVNRVASNSRYSEIMTDLTKRVDSWRAKSESTR